MAHKTLIGGTAYEISGGKTLIDGTAYSIKSGKTLVGGTAYEVGFAPDMATVNITAPWGTNYNANVTINGVEYNSSVAIEVPIGTTVFCTAIDLFGNRQYITLNGTQVASDTYEYTVVGNATIELTDDYGNGSKELYGVINITEIPEDYVLLTVTGYSGSVTVDGEAISERGIFVAPGTVVTLYNTGWKCDETESYIRVNGTTVLDGCGSYNYIATSNATIAGSMSSTGNGTYYYCIDVIEE